MLVHSLHRDTHTQEERLKIDGLVARTTSQLYMIMYIYEMKKPAVPAQVCFFASAGFLRLSEIYLYIQTHTYIRAHRAHVSALSSPRGPRDPRV